MQNNGMNATTPETIARCDQIGSSPPRSCNAVSSTAYIKCLLRTRQQDARTALTVAAVRVPVSVAMPVGDAGWSRWCSTWLVRRWPHRPTAASADTSADATRHAVLPLEVVRGGVRTHDWLWVVLLLVVLVLVLVLQWRRALELSGSGELLDVTLKVLVVRRRSCHVLMDAVPQPSRWAGGPAWWGGRERLLRCERKCGGVVEWALHLMRRLHVMVVLLVLLVLLVLQPLVMLCVYWRCRRHVAVMLLLRPSALWLLRELWVLPHQHYYYCCCPGSPSTPRRGLCGARRADAAMANARVRRVFLGSKQPLRLAGPSARRCSFPTAARD